MRLKITDWASLTVGRNFTVVTLFYFVFEGNFPISSPRGLIFGGTYFRKFYGTFEPASLRLSRGGTGCKLKMSLFFMFSRKHSAQQRK